MALLQPYNRKLLKRQDLSLEESINCGHELFAATAAPIASFLSLLAAKGEVANELVGLVIAIRQYATELTIGYPTLDIVGTGGDGASTLNISTASCLLAAACGIPILKHGNRAISSRSGAADVLEVLGYPIDLSPEEIKIALEKDNFAFCFAPNYHPLLVHVRDVRQWLGFSTVFNLLGPLLNPAGLDYMLLGIGDKTKLEVVAQALCRLGTKCSIVFHGNGLDELTCLGVVDAYLIKDQQVQRFDIDPQALGFKLCSMQDLAGFDAVYNARIIEQTLSGTKTGLTDTLLLNVGVALFVFGRFNSIAEGVVFAKERLQQGNIVRHNRLNEIVNTKQKPQLSADLHDKLAIAHQQFSAQEQLDLQNAAKITVTHEILPRTVFYKQTKSLKQALLSRKSAAVISEIKRASPSMGQIAVIDNLVERARLYVSLGAVAISILTDAAFAGSTNDLVEVCAAFKDTRVPILRKEFILYPEQVAETKICGADAILLMVSVLGTKTKYFVELAHAFGLETLVEIHAPHELKIALESGSDIIGVNQRDLRDFSMHPEIFSRLLRSLPKDMVRVAESGIKTAEAAKELFALGYDGVLVGEALSRVMCPADFFKGL